MAIAAGGGANGPVVEAGADVGTGGSAAVGGGVGAEIGVGVETAARCCDPNNSCPVVVVVVLLLCLKSVSTFSSSVDKLYTEACRL